MEVVHLYKTPGLSANQLSALKLNIKRNYPSLTLNIQTELCYNIATQTPLTAEDKSKLVWLIAEHFHEDSVCDTTTLGVDEKPTLLLEFGPRLNFATAFSTNAVAICKRIGLVQIERIEVSRRYSFNVRGCFDEALLKGFKTDVGGMLHDKMTEMVYPEALRSFDVSTAREEVYEIDVLSRGESALREASSTLGLAFDEQDIGYYHDIFVNKLHRNPTNVELFDLAQSNSEHSRHWFFKGKIILQKNIPSKLSC